MHAKYNKLIHILRELKSVAVAYSGGVDSSFLLYAVKESSIDAIAITANSPATPKEDIKLAISFASELNIPHRIIETDELYRREFCENTEMRCFYCKDILFSSIKKIIKDKDIQWIIEGSNADDLKDYRPGLKARERHNVRSPLIEVGLTKKEIRELSKTFGLKTWQRPSSPCLSSRFPYGTRITPEGLGMVEQAEEFLKSLGFKTLRVRHHGHLARIEVSQEDIVRFFDDHLRRTVVEEFLRIGYKFVSLDLEGFKSGKLNRIINNYNQC
ncbi:MAG: ATP-dependent sacrificial sulfur transferase LarE [Nitrospirae bacterium]|nr:ATP-dependent sacrificial sulfur transferase LarE [Nitrospirota bacterium]